MTEVRDESQAQEYADPWIVVCCEKIEELEAVEVVKAQTRMAMKQMGTIIDLAMTAKLLSTSGSWYL